VVLKHAMAKADLSAGPLAKARRGIHRGLFAIACLCTVGLAALLGAGASSVASAAESTACPDEASRQGPSAALPDCRVYEAVSPVATEGHVQSYVPRAGAGFLTRNSDHGVYTVRPFEVAPDGEAMIYEGNTPSTGGSGNDRQGGGNAYLSTRSPGGGWSSINIQPPGFSPAYLGFTSDLTSGVLRSGEDLTAAPPTRSFLDLFSHSTLAGGAGEYRPLFTKTPAEPDTESTLGFGGLNTGAPDSPAATHILFRAQNALLEEGPQESELEAAVAEARAEASHLGDGPKVLYDATDGRPHLVSVLPDGRPSVSATFGGPSAAQLSENAGPFESAGLDGAISADGSRVFWSTLEPIGERAGSLYGPRTLYLRENDAQPQSALAAGKCTEPLKACTVAVSTSEKTDGTGPGGADPAGPGPAQFWAASSDGSKALFTSPEELTDDADTGPGAALGRANLDGSAPDQGFISEAAQGVAVDGSHIYWANPAANSIGRANLDGTGVERSFITGARHPQGVAADGGHIYWTSPAGDRQEEGTIGRADLDGTGVEGSFITALTNPSGIAADASHLYWTQEQAGSTNHEIGRANLDGSGVERSFVQFNSTPGETSGLAVDGSHLFFTRNRGRGEVGGIGRADLDGTAVETSFITDTKRPQAVVVDGSHIFWTNDGDGNEGQGTIGRADLDGTAVERSFITGATSPRGIALDGAHLYWANNGADRESDLYRFDAQAPEGARLTDLTPAPGADVKGLIGTSADGSYVYFVAGGALASGATPGDCEQAEVPLPSVQAEAEAAEEEIQEERLGRIPPGRACNIYLAHTGEPLRFIASIPARDNTEVIPFSGGGLEPVESTGDWQTSAGYRSSQVTPSGRSIVFMSKTSLTGYDNRYTYVEPESGRTTTVALDETFLYEAGSPRPVCISCNAQGQPPVATHYDGYSAPIGGFIPTADKFRDYRAPLRVISEDGGRVFFDSAEPLVAQDTNGWLDVYEWERAGTGSCRQVQGCIYLLSDGTESESSYLLGSGGSGEDVFLVTRAQLVAQDHNENFDVYDARVGGVLLGEEAPPCEGEACRSALVSPPAVKPPGTGTFAGPGTPRPFKCKKGQVRKHGRCVAKRSKKPRHHKKSTKPHAGTHRRSGQ
jgi:virginiamycin B lyase